MIKIVIDDAIPYIKGVLEPFCEVVYLDGNKISPCDVKDAQALMVRTRTRCDESLLSGSAVRAIATATIGFDHIDMDYCCRQGIEVFTAAGCNARGVLQWLGAVLVDASRVGGWDPPQKKLGIVGTGNVGSLTAVYGRIWGFDIMCCDPPREEAGLPAPAGCGYSQLQDIARQCDIITLHTPLSYDGPYATFHMADEDFFGRVRPGTLILNSSRGEVVDSAALLGSIKEGKCMAAIDTWEHEPSIDRELLESTLLATPHIAGYTAQGKANASAMSLNALAHFFRFPLNEWYPYGQVEQIAPRAISWEELKTTIGQYFDIRGEDSLLKSRPEDFESIRTSYIYRQEYF